MLADERGLVRSLFRLLIGGVDLVVPYRETCTGQQLVEQLRFRKSGLRVVADEDVVLIRQSRCFSYHSVAISILANKPLLARIDVVLDLAAV